jgi:hypothetical protein
MALKEIPPQIADRVEAEKWLLEWSANRDDVTVWSHLRLIVEAFIGQTVYERSENNNDF